MERKKTSLEQKLISSGYTLSHKTYKGKRSQKVEYYVYVGTLDNYKVRIYLDSKRTKVEFYTIENLLLHYLGYENIKTLENNYAELTKFIYSLSDDYDVDEQLETVEILESEIDETKI